MMVLYRQAVQEVLLTCNLAGLQIPTNLQLVAVPLYELYENAANFGPVVAAVPQMIARFRLNITGPLATPSQPAATAAKAKEAPADDDLLAMQLYGA